MNSIRIYVKLILLVIFVNKQSKAQTTDTLQYLKSEIEAKKSIYINKPFSVLLANLKVKPVSVFAIGDMSNKHRETKTEFYYSTGGPGTGSPYITIIWSTPLPREVTRPVQASNNWMFTEQLKSFYSTQLVRDIIVEKSFLYKTQ